MGDKNISSKNNPFKEIKEIKNLISTILFIFSIAFTLSFSSSTSASTPPFWKDSGYIYSANQTPIKKILEDFCDQFGIVLEISPSVKGTINGRLAANSAGEFLDRLALMRKFRWFVYSNTLYVSTLNDNVVEKMTITGDSSAEAKQALIGIGLFENKFGWGELPEEHAIILSGPVEYIKLVKKVVGKDEGKKADSDIMIFRLKYANADDREIQYRNRVIVTPGVATILRNLLQDKRVKGSNTDLGSALRNPYGGGGNNINTNFNATGGLPPNAMQNSRNPEMNYGGRPNSPFSFLSGGNGGEVNTSLDQNVVNANQPSYMTGFNVSGSSSSKGDKNRVPMVEADVRMNAVIIRDDSNKKSYYQALINEFDQLPKMVEIEAMILDINRSKLKDLGIDWTVKAGKSSIGVSSTATGSTLNVLNNALGAGSSILIRNIENFYGRINALEQDGEAYVLAKPSIITVDNLGAVLDLNRTSYIRLIGERVADVMPVTAGTLLKVTPRVINEGGSTRVHLVVDIEDGELLEAEGSGTPSVQRSTISTQAIIEENQALVIGGYQSQTDNRTKQRIPGLGSIPYVGALFTHTNNAKSNKERIFIIVPRAITRNYKRTYGNNVEGTPLPPLPFSPSNMTTSKSSNGLGQIIYNNQESQAQTTQTNITQTINKINNINNKNFINSNSQNNQSNDNQAFNIVVPPPNPFTRSADVPPPSPSIAKKIAINKSVSLNNLNTTLGLSNSYNNTSKSSSNTNGNNPVSSRYSANTNAVTNASNNNNNANIRDVSYLLKGKQVVSNNYQNNSLLLSNELSNMQSIKPNKTAATTANDKFLTER